MDKLPELKPGDEIELDGLDQDEIGFFWFLDVRVNGTIYSIDEQDQAAVYNRLKNDFGLIKSGDKAIVPGGSDDWINAFES